jgi:signal peptidase
MAIVLFIAWLVLLRPTLLGGSASYIWVAGDSMEPTLEPGDLAVVRKQSSYSSGDIVVFRVPKGEPGEGAVLIHRVVGGSAEDGFTTQGDNSETVDRWRPTGEDIVGRMWFSVPGAGRLLAFLQGPLPLAGLASGLTVFLVLSGGTEDKRPRKVSPRKLGGAARLPWRPPGLTLWLLLVAVALMIRR